MAEAGRIVSLLGREDEPEVLDLLAESQIHLAGDEARRFAPAVAQEYATRETFGLWGYEDAGRLVGVAGIEWSLEGRMRLADLAVAPLSRRRGVGRALADHLRYVLQPRSVAGLTLAGAVAFFEACGFKVEPVGYTASGEQRFGFTWFASLDPRTGGVPRD